ncbi:MAG: hypothetical protein H7Z19_05360 [Chitinophagaceae bacterium]|nr:hypothetical protein [Rubrivivax sp.]
MLTEDTMTMTAHSLTRRALLSAFALPWLVAGCSSPLPLVKAPAGDADADSRLRDSAQAHGLDAYRSLHDINVSYSGEWRPLVNRIQPEVVDAGFRGSSQERLMPGAGIVAQAYTGPMGRKHVVWRRSGRVPAEMGSAAVWFNGVRSSNAAAQSAAALVAEGYGLFLLGPLWLVDRGLRAQMSGTERVDGRLCDVIDVWLSPGLGRVATDRVALCIDRGDSLMRRVRFTLEGFVNTKGAVAEVDTFEHERRFGVVWPMRSYERIVHPISLPAHDWRITGLDVNRGYEPNDVTEGSLQGGAVAPAAPV